MEQYKEGHNNQHDGKQPTHNNAGMGMNPHFIQDKHAPATLFPAVLDHLGLSNENTARTAQPSSPIALHSSDWRVRLAAVRALGKMGKQAPLEPLLAALQDEDASVRASAIQGLGALGERVPVERLVDALHDANWHVRETAVLILGKLLSEQPLTGQAGPGRPQRSPLHLVSPAVFDEVLHDSDSTVREAAQLALQWTRQRVLNQNNDYVTRRQNGISPGGTMQEQQEQRQQPSMQELEYEYYAYQGDDRARQWEKVTSYTPRKNYRPFWIGGIAGGIVFLIVAANALMWGFNAYNASVKQIDFIKPTPTMMPNPIPTSTNQTLYTYQNHRATVNAVAWSPNGLRIASASDDNTVQVWDDLTGEHAFVFGGHTAPVDTVAWSPDGTRIASGSSDGTIEVWNPTNGYIFFTYHFDQAVADSQHIGALQALSGGGNPGVYTLAWSPDGTRIAAAMGSSVVKEFDARTGNTLFTYTGFVGTYYGHPSKINAMAWSPDGRYIITAGDAFPTTIWNASNGNTVYTYPTNDKDLVFSLAWSPEGKRVAIGFIDGSVRIWIPATNSILALNGHAQNIYALAWSPDGTRLATASIDHTVQILNATTGEQIYVYIGHSNELRTVAWSPTDKLIATGSSDDTVQVWKVPQQ